MAVSGHELPSRVGHEDVDSDWLETLIERVHLGDRRDHRPSELPGGARIDVLSAMRYE